MNQADQAPDSAADEADEVDEPDVTLSDASAADDQPSLLPEDEATDEPTMASAAEITVESEEEPEAEEEPEERPDVDTHIYAVKTTINQENSVAQMIANKAEKHDVPVLAILHPTELRGYLLIEAMDRVRFEEMVRGLPHMRGIVEGETDLEEVQHFLTPKPSVEGIAEGDIVELISGPFKGEKARVQRIDEAKEEITVELFEAMVPIPVTVSGDAVRVLEKQDE